MLPAIRTFARDQSGAITVDWTVLTGAVVGLGLATMALVSGGVEDLVSDIDTQLRDGDWNPFDNGLIELATFDFSNGEAAGWVGGRVMDMGGQMGELLVLGARETAGFLLEVPDGAEMAYMSFDLVAGDSLDNSQRWGTDTATLMINDTPVAIAVSDHRSMTFDIPQVDGTTVEAVVTVEAQQLGGEERWLDDAAQVTVQVSDPTADLQFHLVSDSDQGIRDEFWGIDNFSAGTDGAPGF